MVLFKKFREKRIEDIIDRVNKKNIFGRYVMLLSGCLIVAFAFNLFFLRFNIVCFGVSGISIVVQKFGINPSTFIIITDGFSPSISKGISYLISFELLLVLFIK